MLQKLHLIDLLEQFGYAGGIVGAGNELGAELNLVWKQETKKYIT